MNGATQKNPARGAALPFFGRTASGRGGFTLLEMLASLIIGTLILGGVMGLISTSMQYKFRIKEKSRVQPVLESAAQIILADPARAGEGAIRFPELDGAPTVGVRTAPVPLGDSGAGNKAGQLYRVVLDYKGSLLEFSVIAPNKDFN